MIGKSEELSPLPQEERVRQILRETGVVITDSHVVYTSGRHGDSYINKDAIYPHTKETQELCAMIGEQFKEAGVEVVIGPAYGGIILAHATAAYLTTVIGREVIGIFVEKTEGGFALKRGYADFIPGRRILVVEDVLTTGGSARKVIELVRGILEQGEEHEPRGEIVGLAVLCNRGKVTAENVGNVPLFALLNVNMQSWPEEECHLCATGVSINTSVGKGAEYLKRKHDV